MTGFSAGHSGKWQWPRSFFRHHLPEDIRRHVDLDRLEITDGTYVDEKLRDKHSDIVYRTKIKGLTAFLYILFEHQSSPDPLMVFRLLCYMVNLWREYRDQNPKAKKLPVIIPLVLYHGPEKWNSPMTFSGMIEGHNDDLCVFIPDFTYHLYDLKKYRDENLMIGEMELRAVLHLFRHIFDADFGDHMVRTMQILAQMTDRTKSFEFLEITLRYVYHARNDDRETVKAYIDRGISCFDSERAKEVAMTVAEQIRQEGRMQGRVEGKMEGKYSLLSVMLAERFGKVSRQIEQKLGVSDAGTLDRFGRAIFRFRDLRDAEKWWADNEKDGNA